MFKKALLLEVSESQDVIAIRDPETGESLPFEVKPFKEDNEGLEEGVHMAAGPARLLSDVRRKLNDAMAHEKCFACYPMPHVAVHGRHLTGAVFAMAPDDTPGVSGFPVRSRNTVGMSLQEIEKRLPSSAFISVDFLRSPEFTAYVNEAVETLSRPAGTPPGLINPGTPAMAALSEHMSPDYPQDSIVQPFRPGYMKGRSAWVPHLGPRDCIRVCHSKWGNVNPQTAAVWGHGDMDDHFYVWIKWHLPESIADQLWQLVRINPERQSFKELATRKEFTRALEISKAARESIVSRFLKLIGRALLSEKALSEKARLTGPRRAQPRAEAERQEDVPHDERRPRPRRVLLRRRRPRLLLQQLLPHAPRARPPRPRAARAGRPRAAPQSQGGVISMTENDPDSPIYWWHGEHDPDTVGGDSWEAAGIAHAMPCLGPTLAWKRSTVDALVHSGFHVEHGYVKLTPIV